MISWRNWFNSQLLKVLEKARSPLKNKEAEVISFWLWYNGRYISLHHDLRNEGSWLGFFERIAMIHNSQNVVIWDWQYLREIEKSSKLLDIILGIKIWKKKNLQGGGGGGGHPGARKISILRKMEIFDIFGYYIRN